jgi:hypothetical protein
MGRQDYQVYFMLALLDWFKELDKMIETHCFNGGDSLDLYPDGKLTWNEAYWRTLIADNGITKPAPMIYGDYLRC